MKSNKNTPPTVLSVVIPCYNEQDALPKLLEVTGKFLSKKAGGPWELILVDDGSTDRTRSMICQANLKNPRVKGVFLSRNFGHQAALFAGLQYASGKFVGIMDADLQDPPEVLGQCLRRAKTEKLDVVYAVRKTRNANPFLKLSYWLFYRLMGRLAEHSWPLDAGDFSVITQKACRLILQFPEHVRVLRGLRSWIGLRQGFIHYERPQRYRGDSKYTFFKLATLALTSLISFSSLPLRLASLIGLGMSLASLTLAGIFLANRLIPGADFFGYYVGKNPGTTTLAILILLLGSLLFFCLGILGEYLVVMVKELKARPAAIVQGCVGMRRLAPKNPHIFTFP